MTQTKSFQHVPESVTGARRFAERVLKAVPADIRDTALLMVSELASNCIRHTDGGFRLTISQTPREIRVEATDRGSGEPRAGNPGPTDEHGRGLQIIDMFSGAWGTVGGGGQGKTVWFTVAL